jgi:hypothetical protein
MVLFIFEQYRAKVVLQMPFHDQAFQTNDLVPASGTYDILHAQHLLAKQVVLFKSEIFPKCSRCDSPITFLLHHEVRGLDYVHHLDVRVPLLEIQPVTLEDSPQNADAQLQEEL